MLAVGMSKEDAIATIGDRTDKVSIAAVNGPTNITLAGETETLASIAMELTSADIFNKKLDVDIPYHSPQMDPILEDLRNALTHISPKKPQIPLFSTVTGERAEDTAYGAEYWPLNVRMSVEFSRAIDQLIDEGFTTFVEVGPHPVLATSIRDCIKAAGKDCRQSYTLRRNQPELDCIHQAIMSVYALGCDLDWNRHNGTGKMVQLPNYAWQRETLWNENDRAMQARIAPIEYPLLGEQEAPAVPTYRLDFDHEPLCYMRDHVVSGMAILPAAAYIESLLEMANVQFENSRKLIIRDFQIQAPLILTKERGTDYTTTFEPLASAVTIRSLENGKLGHGQVHVTAKIGGNKGTTNTKFDSSELNSRIDCEVDTTAFYQSLAKIGLQYQQAFQTLKVLRRKEDGSHVLARLEMQENLTTDLHRYHLHPTLLDGCFQSLIAMLGNLDATFLPTGFAELILYNTQMPSSIWCFSEMTSRDEKNITCNLTIVDDDRNVLATIRGMQLTAATKKQRVDQFGDPVKRQILAYDWNYDEMLSEPKRLGHWLIIGGSADLAQQVATRLEQCGATIAASKHSFNTQTPVNSNPSSSHPSDEIKLLLETVGDLNGVVYLPAERLVENNVDPTGQKDLEILVALSQALLERETPEPPRCYVVTRQAFGIGDTEAAVDPSQTAINGFVRVAFNELEGLRFTSIDVPSRPSLETIDNLVMELVCDSEHDEVALRGGLRLTSELKESPILENDRGETGFLDDQHPVSIRSLREGANSIGTARVLESTMGPVGDNDVCLRVDHILLPQEILLEDSAAQQHHDSIPVVGRIISKGANVNDFNVGIRVAGFAPFDIASHFIGNQAEFCLVEIPEELNGSTLVTTLEDAVRAENAVAALRLNAGQLALVHRTPLGQRIGQSLERRHVQVTYVEDPTGNGTDYCSEAIAKLIRTTEQGRGFDLLVANAAQWSIDHGMRMICEGGSVLDTNDQAVELPLPRNIQSIVRTTSAFQQFDMKRLREALAQVVTEIMAGKLEVTPALPLTVTDLAWQKLTVGDTKANLALSFETHGKDLPIVQHDDLRFSPEATYLVTGGFGGFGRKTAEWLMSNGAKHLVLTGRTGADSTERRMIVRRLVEMYFLKSPLKCLPLKACSTPAH
jgi:acyl transferase domain-containing protein